MTIKKMLKLSALSLALMGLCLGVGLLASPLQSKAMAEDNATASEPTAGPSSSLQGDEGFYVDGDRYPTVSTSQLQDDTYRMSINWSDEDGHHSTSRTFDVETCRLGFKIAEETDHVTPGQISEIEVKGYMYIKNHSICGLTKLKVVSFKTADGSPYDVNFADNDANPYDAIVTDCAILNRIEIESPDFNEDWSEYTCVVGNCPQLQSVRIDGDWGPFWGPYGDMHCVSDKLNRAFQNPVQNAMLKHFYDDPYDCRDAYDVQNGNWVRIR